MTTTESSKLYATEEIAVPAAKALANGRPILAKKVVFDGHARDPRPITGIYKLGPQGWIKITNVARDRLVRGSHVMVDYSVPGQVTVGNVL